MPRLFEYWGYERIAYQGRELGPFRQVSLFEEDVSLVQLRNFSELGRAVMKKHIHFWDQRLLIGSGLTTDKKRAA